MAIQKLTTAQRYRINKLRERAWAAGLTEATFSQIAKDPEMWELDITSAEAEAEAA
jgi:hypothetical protein